MRERPRLSTDFHKRLRITPARAGKTQLGLHLQNADGDHPRSCGKDLSHDPPRQHLRGSPPLVRERRTASCKPDNGSGITPARAGKTVKTLPIRRQCQDHPRSCGKDSPLSSSRYEPIGSPPLVRERRHKKLTGRIHHGITPARAGKTSRP